MNRRSPSALEGSWGLLRSGSTALEHSALLSKAILSVYGRAAARPEAVPQKVGSNRGSTVAAGKPHPLARWSQRS